MEPLTTTSVAIALSTGIKLLADQLVGKTFLDPILNPIAEQLQEKIPIFKKAENKALEQAVANALADLDVDTADDDAVANWLTNSTLDRLTAPKNDSLRRQIAQAILTQANVHGAPPDSLMLALGWPRSRQGELAQILRVLRQHISSVDGWQQLIEYVDREAERGQLAQIATSLKQFEQIIILTQNGLALRIALVEHGLSQQEAVRLEQQYRDGLVRDLWQHDFRGIVQMKEDIRLPLTDIYQELGLLTRKGTDEHRQIQEEILVLRQEERNIKEERHIDDRVTDALEKNQRLVILGEPGAGKTTSLRFIALMLAHGTGITRLGLETPFIPIQVRMADYARTLEKKPTLSLDNYLIQTLQEQFVYKRLDEFLRLALHNGTCMVLLDGLDEIGDDPVQGVPLRTQVVKQVQLFGDRWCNQEYDEANTNRLIVTSRIEGYWGEPLRGCPHVQLSPLRPPDEIETFLVRWFTAHEIAHDSEIDPILANRRAVDKVKEMLPRMMETPSVRRLATNPLLLTILALIHENVGRLPNRRIKLYEICAQTLIDSWRKSQTGLRSQLLVDLGEETVIRIMAPLAYWLHKERPGGTASHSEWQSQLKSILIEEGFEEEADDLSSRFLHHARHSAGLLAERGLNQFGFFHLTFEEYLAARQIARKRTQERRELLKEHWEDPRWTEVILLAAGQLGIIQASTDDTSDFLEDLLGDNMSAKDPANEGRQVVLAGRALADLGRRSVNRTTYKSVTGALEETMKDLDPETEQPSDPPKTTIRIRYEAGEVLDELGWLPPDLNSWKSCPRCGDNDQDLLVAKYPVTNAQFAYFVAQGGSEPRAWNDSRFGKERHGYPVVRVSWHQAVEYANWLTQLLEQVQQGALDPKSETGSLVAELVDKGVTEIRLPTEQEWERAAGGTQNERYPWDVDTPTQQEASLITPRANVRASDLGGTSPVAMYPLGLSQPNGLADMAGNIWEWTNSWYDSDEDARVLRGGSWYYNHSFAPVGVRGDDAPHGSYDSVGFRLCAPIGSGY